MPNHPTSLETYAVASLLALSIVGQFSQTGFQAALVQRSKDVELYLDAAFTWHVLRGVS